MNDSGATTFKDRFYLSLLRFFSRLPLPFLQAFGARIGWLAARMHNGSAYRVVRRNLELCFPEASPEWIEKTVRDNLVATAPIAFECAKSWGMPADYTVQMIRKVHNEEIFFEAMAAGRGTLAIAPHFGTFELMNAWLKQHTENTIMFKPGKDKGVNAYVRQARSRYCTILPADDSGVRGSFKALRHGGFCAILPDHVPQDNAGIYAPFFGISTWTGVIVPKLVQRTGCTVLMMSCARRPCGDGFEIWFERPDPEIYSADLFTSAAAMNRTIESLIRRAPTHYFWFYKRFKNNETLPDPYCRQAGRNSVAA
jgi:KDO2-lipid IV(A) lauroyltransferase